MITSDMSFEQAERQIRNPSGERCPPTLGFGAAFAVPGVYVVQFPDCVKLGQSMNCWSRLGDHVKHGAGAAAMFVIDLPDHPLASFRQRLLRAVEQRAVAEVAAQSDAPMPYTTESFTDVSLRTACLAVRNVRAHVREFTFPDLQRIHPSARVVDPIGA